MELVQKIPENYGKKDVLECSYSGKEIEDPKEGYHYCKKCDQALSKKSHDLQVHTNMIKVVREVTKTVKWEKKSDDIDDHGDPRMKEDAEKVISGEYVEDPEARRTRLVQE